METFASFPAAHGIAHAHRKGCRMTAFVLQQMDYVFFIYGLSFILLGGVCFYISTDRKNSIAWEWLGAFGALHGANEWLELIAMNLVDTPMGLWLRLIVLAVSFFCLCEFGRRTTITSPAVASWIWIYTLLLAGAATGGVWGAEGLNVSIRYVLGFIGSIWAALALLRAAGIPRQPGKVPLHVAAACFAAYAIAAGLIVPPAPMFPANYLNQPAFLHTVGLPIQLIRALLAIAAAASLWQYLIARRSASAETLGPKRPSPYIHLLAFGIVIVVIAGWVVTNMAGQLPTDRIQEQFLQHTGDIAATWAPIAGWQQDIAVNRLVVISMTGLVIFLLAGSLLSVQSFQDSNEQMLASERLYRTVVDNSPSSLQLLDTHGRCLTVNPKGLEKIGRSEREMLGMQYLDFWPPQTRPVVKAAFAKALQGQQTSFEANYLRPDGKAITWQVVLNPVKNSQGQTHRVVEIATDITDYRRTEAQLRRAKEKAEAATQAKTEFLANMSHEIRTPITAILGYADLLREPNLSQDDQANHLETIHRNGEILLDLIDDILDISKIEAGKLEVEHTECSPWQILADVAAGMQSRANLKGLALSIESDGPLPKTILSDPARLRQILANLLGNAVKFTEAGQVRVIARMLNQRGCEPMLQFDVIDTGIGIATDELVSIFQPFTQADSSSHRRYGGTGLGLTISKRLAMALGGDITVASELGKGSTFSVTIATGPINIMSLSEPSKSVVAGAIANNPRPKLDCRILLAEDGPDNQRLLSLVLKKAGADVTIAQNGREAVEMALASFAGWGRRHNDPTAPFDIILMDIQMPLLDGFEATRQLRQEGYTGPIIALSAHATTQAAHECLDAGCDDYLSKPIDRDALLRKIAAHLAKTTNQRKAAANHPPLADETSTAQQNPHNDSASSL